MATKRMTLNNDGMTAMVKEAVSAGREWSVAMREATLNPMLKMFAWNQPMMAMMEPWIEMTRQAHDRWLDFWEAQSLEMIDRTTRVVESSARQMTKEALS